jgi:capsular polysaccharide biosynthesis protein
MLCPRSATVFSCALFNTAVGQNNIAQYPSALGTLRDLVDRRLGSLQSRFGARLWLERGQGVQNGGMVVNKERVYELLAAHDFQVVDMAKLPIADQLASMRGAQVIAGAHGAQFVHCQFMPRRSTVIECFSPVHVNPSVIEICRTLGHTYHRVVSRSHVIAPYSLGRDCRVDCESLSSRL